MSPVHIVVDGSNIATEGRTTPSLRQLDDAVRQFQDEFPEAEPIVVVDATFGHRIDPSERKAFEEALSHGEIVSPPAGAIGRGDAFVLRIAERVNGQVLSNDSFQEFLPEHSWLFDEGRLIGGKPVPGVGWIFTPRRPVRPHGGAAASKAAARPTGGSRSGTSAGSGRRRSRAGVLEAVEAAAAQATEAAALPADGRGAPAPADAASTSPARTSPARRRRRRRRRPGDPAVQAAIDAATEEAVGTPPAPDEGKRATTVAAGLVHGPQAVNDPLTFLTFISEHPLGDEVRGSVSTFVSHGAMVEVGDMHCYVPLSGLGMPPPTSARAVLKKGETRRFVVVALDPARRGAQLALPEVAAQAAPAPAAAGETVGGSRRTTRGGTSKKAKRATATSAKAAKAPKPASAAKAKAAKASKKAQKQAASDGQGAPGATDRKAKVAAAPKSAAKARSAPKAPAPAKKSGGSKKSGAGRQGRSTTSGQIVPGARRGTRRQTGS